MFVPGVVALWAVLACLVASTACYVRAARGDTRARELGRQMYALAAFATVLAALILLYLLLSHDFRVNYVYSYSDRELALPYLVSAFWAGQEGSFLFWLLAGMLIGLPLIRTAREYEDPVLIVYTLTQVALAIILIRQSPFHFISDLPSGQVPADGAGLNPLLQNPWMTIHPPVMFIGYAATAVPFSFALAGLWRRQFDHWVTVSLPWALVSVLTLGSAIALGGYWAYVTLGWGGYWGWDPVENSSLVPWLASTALVHGMVLQKTSQRFRRLNFSLAILTFLLVVYATFLTRSGVLADFSVHSFVDLGITGWLVAYLVFFLLLGAGALAWRWRSVPVRQGEEPLWSRTLLTVVGIATLLATTAMVLLGTSAPLLTRGMANPAQVGPAFYNRVTLPIGIIMAVLLVGVPFFGWQGGATRPWRLLLPGGAGVAVATAAMLLGARQLAFVALLAVASASFLAALIKVFERARRGELRASGAHLAHAGLALMLAGVVTSSAWDRTAKVTLVKDQPARALGFALTLTDIHESHQGAEQTVLVEVRPPRGRTWVATPRLVRNRNSGQLVANPAVRVRPTHDVYLSPVELDPGEPAEGGSPIELSKGQRHTLGALTLGFEGFEMAGGHAKSGPPSIAVRLGTEVAGHAAPLAARVELGDAGLISLPVAVPGLAGTTVKVTAIDADRGRIRLLVSDLPGLAAEPGTPPRFTLDLTVKPLISLVWLGMVVLLIGTLLAVVRRSRPSSSAAVVAPPPPATA